MVAPANPDRTAWAARDAVRTHTAIRTSSSRRNLRPVARDEEQLSGGFMAPLWQAQVLASEANSSQPTLRQTAQNLPVDWHYRPSGTTRPRPDWLRTRRCYHSIVPTLKRPPEDSRSSRFGPPDRCDTRFVPCKRKESRIYRRWTPAQTRHLPTDRGPRSSLV